MTPAARVQAAIELLDRIADGEPAEQVLTRWARASRFAGSKDRAAVRDHVFDALRQWRSSAARGGGESGRARMLGLLRAQDIDPDGIFTGIGHAPATLTQAEAQAGGPPDAAAARDLPDWLWPLLCEGTGAAQAAADAEALRHRAPVDLRVNIARTDRETARARLAEEGIDTAPVALCDTALRVLSGARRVAGSRTFRAGLMELQDAASQAVVAALPCAPGQRVLDYCAGGGGKALALAARLDGPVSAHDADPRRMRDLPLRAARAGARITPVRRPEGLHDLVLCDVPCSGSGSWRRAPEAKWRLEPAGLEALLRVQADILRRAAALVAPGGTLAYATCSLLQRENAAQVEAFLTQYQDFTLQSSREFRLADGGDGFFVAVLARGGLTGAGIAG
jgi:16S rRNA (cytosine967-C5)-methyltransferase